MGASMRMRKSGAVVIGAALLTSVLVGCQKDGDGNGGGPLLGDAGTGGGGDVKGGPFPKELVGTWTYGSVSGFSYQDAITGAYAPASGNNAKLVIKADGSFTEDGLLQSTVYSCTTSLFVQQAGKIKAPGADKLVFTPSKVKTSMQNTCSKSGNFTNRDGEKTAKTYTYALKTDQYGLTLELTMEDGGVISYRPEKS
ncbi:hypothetical protein [Yinghuangia soli]|uniref:Uncharacterized protein n=1 Tax=Yinghuangia soli TaxID=2908204 RepID=A0AA41U4T6_9ACTN|nr:hypothetical protein [Yinghuangia soli]MCF2534028.1 hypothetical protein [Yinghuangia soli]